jgi:hypothetical protein
MGRGQATKVSASPRALYRGLPQALLAWAVLCVASSPGAAQPADPSLIWRTLHGEHFSVTYHEPLEPHARRVLAIVEQVDANLTRSLSWQPSGHTHILLSDESESANGSATVVPRNVIRLFVAAPEDMATIGDYDDWLYLLVLHEHTHVQHLGQYGGVPAVINAILGMTYAPNAVQPGWFIEGLATHEESEHTSAGRLRSSMHDMYLRAAALEDRLLRIDQLSNDPNRWPHGDQRYLYGSRFVNFIARHYGEKALSMIGTQYGRQTLPFGINRMALRATGKTFIALYDDFLAELRSKYAAQRQRIEAEGVVEGRALTAHSDVARAPRYLSDGRVLHYASDGHSTPGLYLDGKLLVRTNDASQAAPHPDGKRILYSNVAPVRDIYGRHDLYSYDLESGESERLTRNWRAYQPDVSPDGRRIVYVVQAAGATHLETAELADLAHTRRRLFEGQPGDQVFTPRWAPDGRRVAFSAWRAGGYRDVLIVDSKSGAWSELSHDRAQDMHPSWAPDGSALYFSSDRDGVPNIYVHTFADQSLRRVSNVLAGAFQPSVSADGKRLLYVSYASHGFGVSELRLDSVQPRPAPAFVDTRPAPARSPAADGRAPEPYDPLPTLLPANYAIEFKRDEFDTELAVSIEGSDLALFHAYRARVGISLEAIQPRFQFHYSYRRAPLVPSISLYRDFEIRNDLIVGGEPRDWTAARSGASASLDYSFAGLFENTSVYTTYTLEHVDKTAPFGGTLDPNDPPPRIPTLGWLPSLGLGWGYSQLQRQAYDISTSRGLATHLSLNVTDPLLGRDLQGATAAWDLSAFTPLPWHSHHVLAMRYGGGQSFGSYVRYFAVGGFPDAVTIDPMALALTGRLPGLGGVALRGYPPGFRVGPHMHLFQMEYRFPIWRMEWGASTLPVYLRNLYGSVFADYGDAFAGGPSNSDFSFGTGGELFLTIVLGYQLVTTLRVGVARGTSAGGETQFYVHLGTPF